MLDLSLEDLVEELKIFSEYQQEVQAEQKKAMNKNKSEYHSESVF